MRKSILVGLLVFCWTGIFYSHDLFLKVDSFFLKPQTDVSISLFNGTFEKSENAVTRDRMLDVSIVGPKTQRIHPDTSQWRDVGTKAVLNFNTGDSGTYVIGVSTASRMLALTAEDFNQYLKHDGVLEILSARKQNDELGKDVRERYSKHVKSIVQIGERRSNSFKMPLGYPVELVPLQNPYDLKQGEVLQVQFLKDSVPVPNHPIYASYDGFHTHDDAGEHREAIQTRTDEKGVAKFKLEKSGRWYIRLIHMEAVDEDEADYESNWATLTFEVK